MSKSNIDLDAEIERLTNMSIYEKAALEQGYDLIGGIDEAGRGPFVGPVVAACVILKKDAFIPGLNDSKQMSESKRERLYDEIIKQSVAYGIGQIDNKVIDEINILNATKKAMMEAVNTMAIRPDFLIIDYVKLTELSIPQLALVKGDCLSISVAAASILAKVTRDRMIRDSSKIYPEYGFESNKGYGTPQHREALMKYGPCPLHRRTFIKNYIA
jgi:ribonuclease HII